jgi:transmembrane sensor
MTAITRERLATLTPDEAAALWLVEQDKGTPVEAGLFEAWLAQSEAHRAAWHAVNTAWDLFDDTDDPSFAALRAAALAETGASATALKRHWRPLAAAAALLVVVGGSVEFVRNRSHDESQIASAAGSERTYTAPSGAVRAYVLADGTHMTLDRTAQARVVLLADRRQVMLDRGNALFSVRHDASRPFTVTARGRSVTDIGTRFAVALENGAMRVALYEGSVRVDGGATGVTLRPGQQLLARAGKADLVLSIASGGEASWRDNLVQFDDVTLAAAADVINQGSVTQLVIADPAVAQLRVSGRFRVRDPARFARVVAELLSLRVVRVGHDRIELHRGR